MKVLLDTHALLWAISEPKRLSARARKIILDDANELILSTASIWEIQLKRRAGKLEFPEEDGFLAEHIRRVGIGRVLAILPEHAYRVLALPATHKDPFDCLLAAQCLSERLPILSADPAFAKLGVNSVW